MLLFFFLQFSDIAIIFLSFWPAALPTSKFLVFSAYFPLLSTGATA
jgi:hypothetical protein